VGQTVKPTPQMMRGYAYARPRAAAEEREAAALAAQNASKSNQTQMQGPSTNPASTTKAPKSRVPSGSRLGITPLSEFLADPNNRIFGSLSAAFPRAGKAQYDIRRRVREGVTRKLQSVGLSAHLPNHSFHGHDQEPTDVHSRLEGVAKEALSLAFERYRPRTEADLAEAAGRNVKSPMRRSRLQSSITLFDFRRALESLGAGCGDEQAIAETVGLLDLDRDGRVAITPFIRFVSMPLNPQEERALNGVFASLVNDAANPAAPLSLTGKADASSSTAALLESIAHNYTVDTENFPHTAQLAAPSPWAILGSSSKVKPRFSVPWPCDIHKSTSVFWLAVNALEAALKEETRRRANVDGSAFVLRQAFQFFDRDGHKHISLGRFHRTLAELGLVDLPQPPFSQLKSSQSLSPTASPRKNQTAGPARKERESLSPTPVIPIFGPNVSVEAAARGFIAESALSPRRQRQAQAQQMEQSANFAGMGSITRSDTDLMDEGRDVNALLFPAASATSGPSSSAEAADPAMHEAARRLVIAVFRRMHGEGDIGTVTGIGGERITPTSSTFEIQALRLSDEKAAHLSQLSFNDFARWAAPLSPPLRRVRDKLKDLFRIYASNGGGGKELGLTFQRLLGATRGHASRQSGKLSLEDFKTLLGKVTATLTNAELQIILDYFDSDGSGMIDLEVFLQSFGIDIPDFR
jgi:hypothetical protein